MKLSILLASSVLAAASLVTTAHGGETSAQPAQVIILKLDDVMAYGAGGSPVSPRWQRVADFVQKSNIKASFGIIGFSLEQDNRDGTQTIRGKIGQECRVLPV
jgi:hypothetical protein